MLGDEYNKDNLIIKVHVKFNMENGVLMEYRIYLIKETKIYLI